MSGAGVLDAPAAAPAAAPARASRVWLRRAEGPALSAEERGGVTLEGPTCLADADAVLRRWARTAPGPRGGYDKTDFAVTFGDVASPVQVYEGRFDLVRADATRARPLLATQIVEVLGMQACLWRPRHLTAQAWAEWQAHAAHEGWVPEAQAFLASIDLSGEGVVVPQAGSPAAGEPATSGDAAEGVRDSDGDSEWKVIVSFAVPPNGDGGPGDSTATDALLDGLADRAGVLLDSGSGGTTVAGVEMRDMDFLYATEREAEALAGAVRTALPEAEVRVVEIEGSGIL